MKLPGWKFLRADTSTADAIGEQLAEMDRAYAAADAELSRLAALRPGLLLDTTANADAKLERHDAEMAAARRAIDVTGARRAALEEEWRRAEASETEARVTRERLNRYAAASKARTAGVALLDAYERAAADLAAKLRQLAAIEQQIAEANLDLPPDYPPIPEAEPNNGRAHVPDTWGTHEVWMDGNGDSHGHAAPGARPPVQGWRRQTVNDFAPTPGAPGFPHRPLGGRVNLPAVDPSAPSYWTPGAAIAAAYDARSIFLRLRGISQ